MKEVDRKSDFDRLKALFRALPSFEISKGEVVFTDLSKGIGIKTEKGFLRIQESRREVDVILDGKLMWSTSFVGHMEKTRGRRRV